MMSSTKPPAGTRDFLPDDVRRREYVIGVVRDVYERYGFEPLETPAFENIETLLGKYGEEGNKLIFKILSRGEHEASGEADLALRYDLTVPLARVVAQYQNELPKFFKRYQIQPVWRADRPARGRFREFYQCDIDAIGSTSPVVEAELLAAVSEVLTELGFRRLRHAPESPRRAARRCSSALASPAAQHGDALVALDKLDKIGVDGCRAGASARVASTPAAAARVPSTFVGRRAPRRRRDGSTRLRELVAHRRGRTAVANLREIVRPGRRRRRRGDALRIDPSLARGLSYYTGAIMEIAVPDLAGSLGGGGRYDNLVGMFLGRDVPACGFSLGLERIIVVMTEREMFPAAVVGGAVDVMVTLWNDELARRRAGAGRGASARAVCASTSIRRRTSSASSSSTRRAGNVPFVAIVGDDERAQGTVIDQGSADRRSADGRARRRGRSTWRQGGNRDGSRRS